MAFPFNSNLFYEPDKAAGNIPVSPVNTKDIGFQLHVPLILGHYTSEEVTDQSQIRQKF
jgi:hypothetical protein